MGFVLGSLIGGSGPDYAGLAAKAEKNRQAAITKGTAAINAAYAPFDQNFYNQRQQAYVDYAMPQIANQYRTAQNQIGFGLANRGLTQSGAANQQWSDLARTNIQARQQASDTGRSQAQQLQQAISQSQNNLLNQLYQAADPAQAQSGAIATAAQFSQPSVFTPVANTFTNLLNNYYASQLFSPQQATVAPQQQPYYGGALPATSSSY